MRVDNNIIQNVLGFEFSIELTDNSGNIVPSGTKTVIGTETVIDIIPNAINKIACTITSLEFFNNYNESLIRKIRDHKINSGNYM